VLLAMIQLPAVWLSLGILGKKFAILARRYNAVTLNDMLFARYQPLLVWLASQPAGGVCRGHDRAVYRRRAPAGNRCRHSLRNRSADFRISIALYTAFGGFRASVLNDTMQGMVMLIGTIVCWSVSFMPRGLTHAVETLQHIDPKLVSPQGRDDILSPPL
jgi:sodium/pantothenate symporter